MRRKKHFGQTDAFFKLCKTLPQILDDVIQSGEIAKSSNTVFDELKALSPDVMKSLYLLSFETYEGFENL